MNYCVLKRPYIAIYILLVLGNTIAIAKKYSKKEIIAFTLKASQTRTYLEAIISGKVTEVQQYVLFIKRNYVIKHKEIPQNMLLLFGHAKEFVALWEKYKSTYAIGKIRSILLKMIILSGSFESMFNTKDLKQNIMNLFEKVEKDGLFANIKFTFKRKK